MKSIIILLTFFSLSLQHNSKPVEAYKGGEWFQFRISYSNWFRAGTATLQIKDNNYKSRPVYHIIGKGKTTGLAKLFFKVRDRYESYFDKQTELPLKFIRDIDEGGHTKNLEIEFNHAKRKAYINNIKYNEKSVATIQSDVQDMVSAFYYLRNNYKTDEIKVNDEIKLNMFFDKENYNFKLKFLGHETIKVRLGNSTQKVKTLKFRPIVQAGRVFKEKESLTLWVSADKNKIPLRVKADLAVGSLRADLEKYRGLKHPFSSIQF